MSPAQPAHKPRAFAPQIPSRIDPPTGLWVPTINIRPALQHGELVAMLPPNANRLHMAPLVEAIKRCMADFDRGDFLVAVGDPALIAVAAIIAAEKTNGKFNLLKWDRLLATYSVTEILV